MNLRISVIIPAKNEEGYIGDCIKALKESLNEIKDYEIIIVDNGSTDSTRDIAKRFGCIVIERPNGNISKLRNTGAEEAKGDILAFVDADCIVNPQWAKICLQKLENDDVGLVGTRAIPNLQHGTWVEKSVYHLFSGSVKRPEHVNWLGTSNLFIKRSLFFNIGGFNEDLKTAEDVAFSHVVRKKNKLIFLEKSIDTIHLRESKSLGELFKRELWRGQGSISSYIHNSYPSDEFISVFAPALILFIIVNGIVFLPIEPFISLCSLAIFLLLPFGLMVKKIKLGSIPLTELFACYPISLTYILARTLAFAKEVTVLIGKQLNAAQ